MTMVKVRHQDTGQFLPHLSWEDWRAWIRREPPEGIWRSCLTCWGRGRLLRVVRRPNGEIAAHVAEDCWTCIGIGSVPA